MPHLSQNIFKGVIEQHQRGLVLCEDDGQVYYLPDVDGWERMLGDYVRIVGVVNEANMINPFRIETDENL